jgi:hypothetical protein
MNKSILSVIRCSLMPSSRCLPEQCPMGSRSHPRATGIRLPIGRQWGFQTAQRILRRSVFRIPPMSRSLQIRKSIASSSPRPPRVPPPPQIRDSLSRLAARATEPTARLSRPVLSWKTSTPVMSSNSRLASTIHPSIPMPKTDVKLVVRSLQRVRSGLEPMFPASTALPQVLKPIRFYRRACARFLPVVLSRLPCAIANRSGRR